MTVETFPFDDRTGDAAEEQKQKQKRVRWQPSKKMIRLKATSVTMAMLLMIICVFRVDGETDAEFTEERRMQLMLVMLIRWRQMRQ